MVSDEIEEQRHVARVQFLADAIERVPGPDARVWNVLHNGIGRSDDVRGLPAGKSAVIIGAIPGIFKIDLAGNRASLPNAHEPDRVEAKPRERIPSRIRHA